LKSNSTFGNIFIIFIELFIVSIIVFFSYKIYSQNIFLEGKLTNKNEMILLSDELRQSSDDLSHFARTFTVTNADKYKQRYFIILNIRDGKFVRPLSYETIYWDLEKSIREQRHPSGKKSSLQERINSLPFTDEEKQYLTLSEKNSNELVNLELEAFKLMKTASNTNTNQALAIAMLHSEKYYHAKHLIMNPIDKFMMSLNSRVSSEIKSINTNISYYIIAMFLSVILLIFVNIYFYFYLKAKDKNYNLTKKKTEKRFKELIESTNTWVWEVNTQGVYTYSSHQIKDLLGYEVKEVLGKTPFDFMEQSESQKIKEEFMKIVSKQDKIVELNNIAIHKDGHKVWILTNGAPFFNEEGEFLGYRGMDVDISVRKSLESKLESYSKSLESEVKSRTEDLEYQAHHDFLTTLPNRVLFNDRLAQAIYNNKRSGTKVALLFIDLDHFKEINDSLGHDIGDEVLKITTQRLKGVIRDKDTLARLGGDEFTIILGDLKQAQSSSILAKKILDVLQEPINILDHVLHVSSSIGISIYPDDGLSTQNLLKYADTAMYKAKDEGRNNFQFYSAEMTEIAFERLVMESSLREAIKNKEFVVYYQPQVNAKTEVIIGMEALVRWEHPTMGLVSPDKFIPLAESTGLIVPIDRMVMKIAMIQIVQWYKEGLNPGTLAINLSIKQLKEKDFIEYLTQLLQETKCKPQWIELEITEGHVMTNPQEAIEILQKINDLGIHLAVDDFGTGYSSLSYLKKLPINKLKIDQSFIKDLPNDEDDVGITKAVIALAKSLNLKIIAEGVETQEQKEFIVENGCSNIQGYLYSRPMPKEEFTLFLKAGLN